MAEIESTANVDFDAQGSVSAEPVVEEVNFSDLMQSDSQGTGTGEPQTQDAVKAESGDSDQQFDAKNQDSINAAIGKRLSKERDKWQNTNEYRLGKMFIEQRMNQDNVDADEAYRRINSDYTDSKAKEYAKNPEQFYKDYLNGQAVRNPAPQTSVADRLTAELVDAQERGIMPNGFTSSDINAEFVGNLQKYGTEAALKMWEYSHANSVSAQIAEQREAPRPMVVGGASVSAPTPNFENMSSRDFAEFEKRIQQATLAGKRVKF